MAARASTLDRIRDICLSLPDTKETLTWGKPHFRVKDKIFAGFGDEGEGPSLGFKLERAHAEAILDDPRFRRAPYVGHHGWVSMDASGIRDWDEVRDLLLESYRLIAPKASLARLDAGTKEPARGTTATRKATGRPKPPSRKAPARRGSRVSSPGGVGRG